MIKNSKFGIYTLLVAIIIPRYASLFFIRTTVDIWRSVILVESTTTFAVPESQTRPLRIADGRISLRKQCRVRTQIP